jgi:hypothetical protein
MDSSASPTIATRAIADGEPAVGSSFRFHRPRGPLCGRGYCFQCEIATPNGRALACQTRLDTDVPKPRRDLLRPLGRVAEHFPPWFYERRFLYPPQLAGLSLHALRYLSSAAPLHDGRRESPPPEGRLYAEREAETVVVGSAPCPEGAYRVDLAFGRLALGVYPDRTLGVLEPDGLTGLHFERLILATGGYERLPPIPGNDLPGVLGLRALETYGRAGGLRPGTRIAAWAPPSVQGRVRACAEQYGLSVVWISERGPRAILGRERVRGIMSDGDIACELFVVGVSQPAIELALQAGATAELSTEGLPIVAVTQTPSWLELTGSAARLTSDVPDVTADDSAFACLCEDVRIGDLKACVSQGFGHPELVKRRTGAMTGPCQGKLCSAAVLSTLRELGVDASPTGSRPLARPVALGELAADA